MQQAWRAASLPVLSRVQQALSPAAICGKALQRVQNASALEVSKE